MTQVERKNYKKTTPTKDVIKDFKFQVDLIRNPERVHSINPWPSYDEKEEEGLK